MYKITSLLSVILCMLSCGPAHNETSYESPSVSADVKVSVDAGRLVSTGYIGNGVQWDPYENDYGFGLVDITDADWKKLYDRLDFMRPAFIRLMVGTSSALKNSTLTGILDYCQSRGVSVMFGDWGGGLVNSSEKKIIEDGLDAAAELVRHLVVDKGYDCIDYYNLINEPNGSWSSAKGDYELWMSAMKYFHSKMKGLELADKVPLVAPDVAIWDVGPSDWVSRSVRDMGLDIGLYDIHTYPSKCTVNSGEYSEIIRAYKKNVPSGKKIVMGEIGFKYIEPEDEKYQQENVRRINNYRYASAEDSQMFVYDYMYGTDMADALFQTVNEGYSGCVAWMLDDAMHRKEAPDKLKIWGMWNIFGDEIFGSEQEKVRPWYYAWSLLCRYMPAGMDFHEVIIEGDSSVRAVYGVKDGKRTLALVNVSDRDLNVEVRAKGTTGFSDAEKYVYGKNMMKTEGDFLLKPSEIRLSLDFTNGVTVGLKAESMLVYTEIKY